MTTAERRRRQIYTYLATLGVLLVCAGIVYLSGLSKTAIKDKKRSSPNPSFGENVLYGFLIFLPSILIVFTNLVLAITIRRFSLLELHKTYTNYDSAVFIKLSTSMFLNTVVIPILVHWGNWYESGGLVQEVYNILIASAILPPFFVLCGPKIVLRKIKQFVELRKNENSLLCQKEAHELFEGPALDMAHRSSILIKTYLVTLFYAPVLPIAYPIGVVALLLQYWSEKYMLLRVHSRPDVLSHELDEAMLTFVSLGTVLYAITNLVFYYDLMDSALAPGIVGLVITIIYNFLPVKQILKLVRSNPQVATNAGNLANMSESEKTYDEALVDFLDDYDRCNPMTAEQGKQRWLNAIRRKNGQPSDPDVFPGVEIPVADNVSRIGLLRKAVGLAGPVRAHKQ